VIASVETRRPVTEQIVVSINIFVDGNLRTTCKIIFFYLRLFSKDTFLSVQILKRSLYRAFQH